MLTTILAIAKRNHRITKRAYPLSFLLNRIFIGFYTVIFAYICYYHVFSGKLNSSFVCYLGTTDYLAFVVYGSAFYALGVSIWMNLGRTMIIELWTGTLESFLISPASRVAYFIGNFIELLGRGLLGFFSIILIGVILGIRWSNINLLGWFLVMGISLISFFSVGVSLAAFMLHVRDTYITQNTLSLVIMVISGVAYPIQMLPEWVQFFSNLFPLTPCLEFARGVLLNNSSLRLSLFQISRILLLSLAYVLAGFWYIKRNEQRIIERMF